MEVAKTAKRDFVVKIRAILPLRKVKHAALAGIYPILGRRCNLWKWCQEGGPKEGWRFFFFFLPLPKTDYTARSDEMTRRLFMRATRIRSLRSCNQKMCADLERARHPQAQGEKHNVLVRTWRKLYKSDANASWKTDIFFAALLLELTPASCFLFCFFFVPKSFLLQSFCRRKWLVNPIKRHWLHEDANKPERHCYFHSLGPPTKITQSSEAVSIPISSLGVSSDILSRAAGRHRLKTHYSTIFMSHGPQWLELVRRGYSVEDVQVEFARVFIFFFLSLAKIGG